MGLGDFFFFLLACTEKYVVATSCSSLLPVSLFHMDVNNTG